MGWLCYILETLPLLHNPYLDGQPCFSKIKVILFVQQLPSAFSKGIKSARCTHIKYIGEDYHVLQSAFLVLSLIAVITASMTSSVPYCHSQKVQSGWGVEAGALEVG